MRKRIGLKVATLLAVTFAVSTAVTVLTTEPLGACLRCNKKQACPAGHCYVDCVNCCYIWNGATYCYK